MFGNPSAEFRCVCIGSYNTPGSCNSGHPPGTASDLRCAYVSLLYGKVHSWDLLVKNMDDVRAGMPILLDRATHNFEECSIGVFVELLPGHVAVVALTNEAKSDDARLGVIPIELLLLPSREDSDNENLFARS